MRRTRPTIEAQAVAGVHRMGQTSTVMVHRLIADDIADIIAAERQRLGQDTGKQPRAGRDLPL